MKLPNDYFIRYDLVGQQDWKYTRIIFYIEPTQEFLARIGLQMKDEQKEFYFKLQLGNEVSYNKINQVEYAISVYAPNIKGWCIATVDVYQFFLKTFKNEGFDLQKIQSIELFGEFKIAKIHLD